MILNYVWAMRIEHLISILILMTSLILLTKTRIRGMVTTFAWQSGLLSAAILFEAILHGESKLYISFAITFLLKVLFVPYLMHYLIKKLRIRHHVANINHPFLLKLGAILLIVFCYYLMIPARGLPWLGANNITAVALAVTLLGMLLLITHHKAIAHVIGFMSMENGIFLLILVSGDMPLVIELGIAFDLLVAVILFGVFFFHIRNNIDSLDVDQLNLLREDIE